MNGSGTSQNLPLKCSPQNLVMENPTLTVKAAMLNPATNKVNYFDLPIAMEALFADVPAMEVQVLVDGWKSVPDDQGTAATVPGVGVPHMDSIKEKLNSSRVKFVVQRQVGTDQFVMYLSCKTLTNATFIVEIKFKQGLDMCKVTVKSPNKQLSDLCKTTIIKILA